MIEEGLLIRLQKAIKHKNNYIRQDSIWTIGNILAENANIISYVFSQGIVSDLMDRALIENDIVRISMLLK